MIGDKIDMGSFSAQRLLVRLKVTTESFKKLLWEAKTRYSRRCILGMRKPVRLSEPVDKLLNL